MLIDNDLVLYWEDVRRKEPVVKVQSPYELTDKEVQEEILRYRKEKRMNRREVVKTELKRLKQDHSGDWGGCSKCATVQKLENELAQIDRREDGQSVASNKVETNKENGGPQKMSNSKLQRVNPLVETAQYVRGTEPGHFYLITNDLDNAVIGFRPLAVDFSRIGGRPIPGITTRVRIVPKVTLTDKDVRLLSRLGNLTAKVHNGETHYSVVTSNAPQTIKDALLILS